MPFPLETARLRLRPFTPDDAPALFEIFRDPEVVRYSSRRVPVASVDEIRPRIERWIAYQDAHGFAMWAVEEKESGTAAGQCGIFEVELKGPEVEVAYFFGRSHWGRGYATEAAREAVRFGFEEVGFERILAFVDPANARSIRVAEKLGMRNEGLARVYDLDLLRFALERPTARR